jgi:chromosome segregation protein
VTQDSTTELLCVRRSGRELALSQLSEGTRDQLYLALRLAVLSLRARTQKGLLPPLLLDDTCVHFDDARTARSFEALAQAAKHIEIVYFTHHENALQAAAQQGAAIYRLAPPA